MLVVVCDAETSSAQWGDTAARHALRKGLAGVGGCRAACATPTRWRRWACRSGPPDVLSIHPDKCGHGFVNTPVIGGGAGAAGRLARDDGDGVVCALRRDAGEVVEAALARMRKEEAMARAGRARRGRRDLGGSAASYAAMGIEEIDARRSMTRASEGGASVATTRRPCTPSIKGLASPRLAPREKPTGLARWSSQNSKAFTFRSSNSTKK